MKKFPMFLTIAVVLILFIGAIGCTPLESQSGDVNGSVTPTTSPTGILMWDYWLNINANGGTGSFQKHLHTGYEWPFIAREPADIGICREGYSFIHWNSKADGTGKAFEPGDAVDANVLSMCTIYAIWEKQDTAPAYWLGLIANGGSMGGHIVCMEDEEWPYIVEEPSALGIENLGYTFKQWNSKVDGTGKAFNPGDPVDIEGRVSHIYAIWEKDSTADRNPDYYLYISANGGTGSAVERMHTNNPGPYVAEEPEKIRISNEGYTFKHWNTKADGTGKVYNPGDTVDTDDLDSYAIYAIWEKDA